MGEDLGSLLAPLGVVLSALFAAGGVAYTQRVTKSLGTREQNRSDFESITAVLRAEIDRLNGQVGVQSEQIQLAKDRASDHEHALRVALRYVQQLLIQLRHSGIEPPPLPPELAERTWEQ